MRFMILKPTTPTDPRVDATSLAALHELMPPVMDCETEREALAYVRRVYPDGLAMPVPITIGSGTTFLLGIIEDPSRTVDPDGEIPFVMGIQAVLQNDADRHRAKKGPVFDRAIWKLKPIKPELGAQRIDVELRSTDLEAPVFTTALLGDVDGKAVVFIEVGGISMSLRFESLFR